MSPQKVRRAAEDVILRAVEMAPSPTPVWMNLDLLVEQAGLPSKRQNVDEIGQYMARANWADVHLLPAQPGGMKRSIKLTTLGYSKANDLMVERSKPVILRTIHAVNWTTWGGIAGVIGLIIALIATNFTAAK